MAGVIRLMLCVSVICGSWCSGIRIRDSNTIRYLRYDPESPTSHTLVCEWENKTVVNDAQWTRNDETVKENTGRLTLNKEFIGTENPQASEGMYRCVRGTDKSEPLALFVVPSRRNVSTEVVHQLDEENVTIDCPLRFGSLYEGWTVRWNVKDSNDNALPSDEYFYRTLDQTADSRFQLVIRNAALKYEGARFQCRAVLDHVVEDSQYIALRLRHDSKITTLGPSNPVVVKSDIGVVICEVEAYPPPTIHFCYNGTCSDFKNHNKIEVISHLRKGKYHNARFILHDMNEDDNGNVTCQVIQADRNTTVERQVMIFLPYKIGVSVEGTVSIVDGTVSGKVSLFFNLKRPINFNYKIEFFNEKGGLLDTMDGKKGVTTFSYLLTVDRSMNVMARLKVGDVSGPPSDPISVTLDEPDGSNGETGHIVIIVVVISVTILTLAVIISATVLILKWRRKKDSADIAGAEENNQENRTQQNRAQHITINQKNPQPDIAIFAPTPGSNVNPAHHMYSMDPCLHVEPCFHHSSVSSECSSIPSRKSSTGYGSATGSAVFHYCNSPCIANRYPRCACNNYDTNIQQQVQQQFHEDLQHDHNERVASTQRLQQPATMNISNMNTQVLRRNSSDPNISRHKQPSSRPLEEHRSNKLLSSSSVV